MTDISTGNMASKLSKDLRGPSHSAWPLVLLLLVAVAGPSACVLWFMTEAMRNEQLAVRDRLTAVYQGQLDTLGTRLDGFWSDKETELAAVSSSNVAEELFAELVRSGVADSVVVYDMEGQVAYPINRSSEATDQAEASSEWLHAWHLEFQQQDYNAAAEAYMIVLGQNASANTTARALRARARCLVKAGANQAAIEILIDKLGGPQCRDAIDQRGYLIFPDAQLRALQLMADHDSDEFQRVLNALILRLNDYSQKLPGGQRRFLMRQVSLIAPDCPELRMLGAETLAEDYLDHRKYNLQPSNSRQFHHSRLGHVWQLPLSVRSATVLALFKEDRILKEIRSLIETELAIPNATVMLIPRDGKPSQPEAFLISPAGSLLQDWQLALWLDDTDPIGTAVDSRTAMYFYSGIVVVLAMISLGGLVARSVTRQMRVTRLRNDLIATVSHELKTPLSSIRALLETLLEGRYRNDEQQRQYLQLATKESARLSRLIDSFLAFSRMEQDGETFNFSEVKVETIAAAAVDAMGERFDASESRLDVEVAAGLPAIKGDAEGLVTVLVNLLDNAHKYTNADKRVALRAYASDGQIHFEVEDNGIGLSRREAKRVFDRFHQVDQSLTRRVGGCGLGLSIVQFIVKAHGGSVSVSSRSGQGSTFTVTLPVAHLSHDHRQMNPIP